MALEDTTEGRAPARAFDSHGENERLGAATATPACAWQAGEGDVITVPWGHPRTVTVEVVKRPEDFSQQVWLHWTADGASGRLLVPAYARIEIVSTTRQVESHEDALARIARALTEGTT